MMSKITHALRSFLPERLYLFIAVITFGMAMLAAPPAALSQSCALCYTQAASAGARMIEALRSGILILIIPPTLMSVCMIFIVNHKRNQFRHDDEPDGGEVKSNDNW